MSGRLCVFGEHSDWAGAWASTYPDVPAGRTLVCGLGWAVCVGGGWRDAGCCADSFPSQPPPLAGRRYPGGALRAVQDDGAPGV